MPPPSPTRDRQDEHGVALILVLILTVLLYALVAELVTTARTARFVGENDALMARMYNHMVYTSFEVEQSLLDDLGSGGETSGSGLPGMGGPPAAGPSGLPGEGTGEGEEEPDPASLADCSRDAWYEPRAFPDNDVTTYAWVEDENRKFNILSLLSPDSEFADEQRQRFIRLIDALREGSEYDLTAADGERLANELVEWMSSRSRSEATLPRPPLKSDREDDPERRDVILPLHLDELMILPGVSEDLFFDMVIDSQPILGLESVLTVWTSLRFDPGDPEKQRQQNNAQGDPANPGQPPGGPGGEPPAGANDPEEQPEGLGILININTATRPVLRCLFTPAEMPDSVIEAILRWRNEEEETTEAVEDLPDDYLGDVNEGLTIKRKVFTDLEQLEEIPEFQNMSNAEVKDKFKALVTTESDVFSVHMAALFKRSEETRVFVLRRARSIVVRQDNGEDGYLHPLVLLEERRGLRVKPIDFPDEPIDDYTFRQMDRFAQEERAWNPFELDFYRPEDERQRMYDYWR